MSVDVTGIIRKGVSLEEIKTALEKKYTLVNVYSTYDVEFFRIIFRDGELPRTLWVSFGENCLIDYGINGVSISLSKWGNSIEVIRYLCETFGGYINENNSDDTGFERVNIELFRLGKDFTSMDKFINKIISEIGYEKLHKVLKLFEEFKTIK